MSSFFIDRPIFAWVLSIITMLFGALAVVQLPVAQYPPIAPPTVSIAATYPGADAVTVENTVTQLIEQNMNGLDNFLYMSSTSDSAGNSAITLTFENGTDPDIAQVQVQNQLQRVTSLLPQVVQQQGINVSKSGDAMMMVVGFISVDGSMNQDDIADYISSNISDPLSRVSGVGSITQFGSRYAMRIWLDADKLVAFNLTTQDVLNAIRIQNNQIAAGQLGGTPSVPGQQLNAPILVQSLLSTPEEFGEIRLKADSDGSTVKLSDVARIELGGENYSIIARFNGSPASGVGVSLATGANALDTAALVREELGRLERNFPPGLKIVYPYDTTPFVKLSIKEVTRTLIEAIILVVLVMYLFLQNVRATLVPTIAVPVTLLGTFAVLHAFGYSVNTLTMFAMVLAIGLLVDDAIVVVENVERLMLEEGLSPKEATKKSMEQIQGPIIGTALVIIAVFMPMMFFGGATGEIYRQFALTIIASYTISTFVALILSPAMCALLLKKPQHVDFKDQKGFFGWFNRVFEKNTNHYTGSVAMMIRKVKRFAVIYLVLVVGGFLLFTSIPKDFLPPEDQGILLASVLMPTGSTQERTQAVLEEINEYFITEEANNVEAVFTVNGFGFAGRGQSTGIIFLRLKDWNERQGAQNTAQAIANRANAALSRIRDPLFIFTTPPPAIIELGTATGFTMQLMDASNMGTEALLAIQSQISAAANATGRVTEVRAQSLPPAPQFKLNIDQDKALNLGLSLADINTTLTTILASTYVNDFIDRGDVKRVMVQGEAPQRMLPEDINNWYVRNNQGEMISFSEFSTSSWQFGPQRLERFNGNPSIQITGQAVQGVSTGQAMDIMTEIANQHPGVEVAWSGMSFQEQSAGNQLPALFGLATIMVFLSLAALYESWSIPFAVILSVALGVLGVVLATYFRGLTNDVYFIVGLLTTIALAAKNAILIVDFAKEGMEKDKMSLYEATVHAVKVRYRPIIMTSLAFMLGVIPLAISTGAGSGAQNAVGTAVLGGMISSTLLVIFFVPVFFVIVRLVFGTKNTKQNEPGQSIALEKELK
ncbi:efflux RND transporter permease subunit [Thorsellia anophelis]|uniref:Efflux pump membrane transporter n=1 Tax=Thorsellia anophelis DSM 18579 TaxID=1123402 RepID=A0A1H9YM78_9GAMM|nr:efflux RND transporter permease subunit [Thorsellia anophelis]SES70182.1 multidrug efflux pump [Thorsellia anophelis DSM 18579]